MTAHAALRLAQAFGTPLEFRTGKQTTSDLARFVKMDIWGTTRLVKVRPMAVGKMTMLEAYAQHGSVSYGLIEAARFRDVLLGAEPDVAERVRVRQAITEMPGNCAFELAAELGMSYRMLYERVFDLLGERLPR